MSIHDALAQHIRQAAETPFELNVSDCGLFIGNWVRDCLGVDPYVDFRGTSPVLNGIEVEPGTVQMVHLVNALAAKLQLEKTETPVRGDIGAFIFHHFLAIGIHSGTAWVGKTPKGIFASRHAKTLIAYRVPHV